MSLESKISVFIYEVLNYQNKNRFGKLNKLENKTNDPIKPFGNNFKIDEKSFFSKNIIKGTTEEKDSSSMEDLLKKSNLKKLYENFYLGYSTRMNIKNFEIYKYNSLNNNTKSSGSYNKIIMDATKKFEEYLIKIRESTYKFVKEGLSNDCELIYKIKAEDNEKIIILGDNHGSFHSVFRIFIRLYFMGIIQSDYTLIDGYRIILLGDIIDRGNFGIEIMYIFFKLIIKNNDEEKLKVILIRGNHEEKATFFKYGFSEEIKKKFPNNYDIIIKSFINFYKYSPSAVILKHSDTNYWLCHGGFKLNLNYGHKIFTQNTRSENLTINWIKILKEANDKLNDEIDENYKELNNAIDEICKELNNKIYKINNFEELIIKRNEITEYIISLNEKKENEILRLYREDSPYMSKIFKTSETYENKNSIIKINKKISDKEKENRVLKKHIDEIQSRIKQIESKTKDIIKEIETRIKTGTLFTENDNNDFTYNEINICQSQIRWNDFNTLETFPSSRTRYNTKSEISYIGPENFLIFLENNNIDFIIRGHTDNLSNAMLLGKGFYDDDDDHYYYINNIYCKEKYNDIYRKEKYNDKLEVIKYPKDIKNRKTENEVATIYPKKFNKNVVNIDKSHNLYPVLTISNNSDKGRDLYADSYIIVSS